MDFKKNVQYIATWKNSLLYFQKAGATLYKLDNHMKSSVRMLKIGDKVTFDNDKIEIFKKETSSNDKAVKQYQQLVLAGADQVGVVKELGGNLTTVSYPDGWELPVPTRYLIVLPDNSN
jgi:hypothetical protein